jgi:putative phage-type endonuclease
MRAYLVPAEQRTPEWYEARLGIATASRFGDIMALTRSGYSASRKNYAAELVVQRLTQVIPEHYENAAMAWGTDNEPVARLHYELATGNAVEETGLWKLTDIDAGASPDGFVNHDGTLEIKCPNTATHLETLRTGKLPRQYLAQVQGQMWVTDRKWCDFVSFDPRLPDNAQMIIIRVDRDQAYIDRLEAELKDFLQEVEDQVEFVRAYGKEK